MPETTQGHRVPGLTVDAVIVQDRDVLLIHRRNEPRGWALPGGFVDEGETVEDATRREVTEETGLEVVLSALVGVFSDPERDPRQHNVSVAFLAALRDAADRGRATAGDDADDARWFPFDALPSLLFDHAHIVGHARELLAPRSASYATARLCTERRCPHR